MRAKIFAWGIICLLLIFFPCCKKTPTSADDVQNPITTGDWTTTAGFGNFDFTVNSARSHITQIVYRFSNWTCGPVTTSGTVTVSSDPGWAISERSFEIEREVHDNVLLTINGTFADSGSQVSGTWVANSYGTTCSGSFSGSPTSVRY